MKVADLRRTILGELAAESPEALVYGKDDAVRLRVDEVLLHDVLDQLVIAGYAKRQHASYMKDGRQHNASGHVLTVDGREYWEELANARTDDFRRDKTGHLIAPEYERQLVDDFHASTQNPKSLIRIDLDNFGRINNEYGHPTGDRVLEAAFGAISAAVAGYGQAIRAGGEEVIVLLSNFDEGQARATASRLREAIRSAEIAYKDRPLFVTASLGVATAPPDASDQLDEIADERQRRAKTQGKDQVIGRDDGLSMASPIGASDSNP